MRNEKSSSPSSRSLALSSDSGRGPEEGFRRSRPKKRETAEGAGAGASAGAATGGAGCAVAVGKAVVEDSGEVTTETGFGPVTSTGASKSDVRLDPLGDCPNDDRAGVIPADCSLADLRRSAELGPADKPALIPADPGAAFSSTPPPDVVNCLSGCGLLPQNAHRLLPSCSAGAASRATASGSPSLERLSQAVF